MMPYEKPYQWQNDPLTFVVYIDINEMLIECFDNVVCDLLSIPRGTDIESLKPAQRTLYRKLFRASVQGHLAIEQFSHDVLSWCWEHAQSNGFEIKFDYHPLFMDECAWVRFTNPSDAALFKLTHC